MSLKVSKGERTFRHPVKVYTPIDGGHATESCNVTYRILPTDEAAQYDESEVGSTAWLHRVVVKVDDLVGDDGESIVWSDAVRDELFKQPHVRLAISRGYADAVGKAKAGN